MLNFFLALALFSMSVNSHPSNFTIDDEFGDETNGLMPIYSPVEDWDQGLTCISCDVNPFEVPLDMSQIFQSTWHEATHRGRGDGTNITVSFTGNAVYVYHIVANTIPYVNTLTRLSFVLDGKKVGEYNHTPDSSSRILYNVPVFASTELETTGHTLVIRGGGLASLLLFDYVVYTSDDGGSETGQSSTSSSISTSTSFGTLSTSLPSVSSFTSSFPSTFSLSSMAASSSPIQNLSVTPSHTPAQSTTPMHTLQTSSLSPPPTITRSPERNSHMSGSAIAGATVGSIAAASLICALLFYRIRRRKRGQEVHVITLNSANEPATPVDDDSAKQETESVLDIKRLSPIWEPLVPMPSYRSSRSGSSGAAVTTVGAYGHSSERGVGVLGEYGTEGHGLGKDIQEIREELARFRAQRPFGRRFLG